MQTMWKKSIECLQNVNHITNVLFADITDVFFFYSANNRVVKQFGYVVDIITIILTRHFLCILAVVVVGMRCARDVL